MGDAQQQWNVPTGQTPPAPPPSRTGSGGALKGCLLATVIVGVICFLGFVALIALVVVAGTAGMATSTVVDGGHRFQEVILSGRYGDPKVVCIPVEGVLFGSGVSMAETNPVAVIAAQLRRAERDADVCGVILFVDSPGGGMTASDVLHREIKRFRAAPGGKPVVVCMMDVAASGGYYISVAADRIIAHPTAITGSIGVMMPLYDATALMKKVGVQSETITSGPYKDIASPFAEKTAEQKRREREILQQLVDDMHERFVTVVAEGRNMDVAEVRQIADGRIFTADEAVELKLVDEIGYQSDAVDAVKALSQVDDVQLVQYRRVITMVDILGAFAKGPEVHLDVGHGLPPLEGGRPMYLWVPPAAGSASP